MANKNESSGSGSPEKEGQVDRRNLLKGAAAAGLGAMALGAAAGSAGASSEKVATAAACPTASIQDLVAQMVGDPEFARVVIAAPERYRAQYNLSRRAVDSLRGLRLEDFDQIQVGDPKAFATGAMTVAGMARHDFAATETCGDVCYYFG